MNELMNSAHFLQNLLSKGLNSGQYPFSYINLLQLFLIHDLMIHNKLNYPHFQKLTEIDSKLTETLRKSWRSGTKNKLFRSIFETGLDLLDSLESEENSEEILRLLVENAITIIQSKNYGKKDIIGEIYHNFLIKTKNSYYAPFYTSNSAAALISNLIFASISKNAQERDTNISHEYDNLKIIDPACGSGTLLTAIYLAIQNNTHFKSEMEAENFHRKMVEAGIWGLDVMPFATDLVKTSLSLLNPKIVCEKCNIYPVMNGVKENGSIFLGSLDILQNNPSIYSNTNHSEKIPMEFKSFDIVIMNPPFSRSANPNLKFGYETQTVQKLMRDKLSNLLKQLELSGIGKAGLGAPFIYLGCQILKENGIIGIIIPRGILSGSSWKKIRLHLLNEFDIEYIISNFDPGNRDHEIEGWNWSQNTDLGEIMLIARKLSGREKPNNQKPTYFINFISKPINELGSKRISASIKNSLQSSDLFSSTFSWTPIIQNQKKIGWLSKISQNFLTKSFHTPCVFAHPSINQYIFNLQECIDKNNNFIALENLVIIQGRYVGCGRDIKQVKTNFSIIDAKTNFPMIKGHQSAMNTLSLDKKFIRYGQPKNTTISENIHFNSAAKLLVATRPHINSECLIACEVKIACLATAFWEIRFKSEYEELHALILLWFNSTFGFLLLLTMSVNSKAQIFKFKKNRLRLFPIPLLTRNEELIQAEKLLSQIKNRSLSPFLGQFDQCKKNMGIRFEIDSFFIRLLRARNIEIADLTEIYALLLKEPSLTLLKYPID